MLTEAENSKQGEAGVKRVLTGIGKFRLEETEGLDTQMGLEWRKDSFPVQLQNQKKELE